MGHKSGREKFARPIAQTSGKGLELCESSGGKS